MMQPPIDPDDLADVPTAQDYKKALLACRPALKSVEGSSRILEMLRAHYRAKDRTITAGDLARAPNVDLANFNAANLTYGTYAKALCEYFKCDPKFKIAILVTFSAGQPGDEFVQWTMLPQVAAALEDLGWVQQRAF